MQNRDALNAELNIKLARAAELRGTDATDELIAVSAEIRSLTDELAVIASREVVAPVETAATAPMSLGRAAAEKLANAPVGTSVKLDRAIIADPFGDVAGAQDVTYPQVLGGISAKPDAPVRFLDLLPVQTATSDSVSYIKEVGFDNAAAARLAGETTPESHITFQKVLEPIANVAHMIRVAEETVSDADGLAQVIDRRGVSGLRTVINAQLLAASNTPNGVKSVVAAASSMLVDFTTTTMIDAVSSAKSSLEELGFAPSVVVLSPMWAESIRTQKLDNGAYLGAGPFAGSNNTLWGLQIVVDSALAGAQALVLDPSVVALHVRNAAEVATDRDIVNGLLTTRVQTRVQCAVERPEGIVAIIAD